MVLKGYQDGFEIPSLLKIPAIRELKRVSKPGLRQYRDSKKLPRVINGLGIAIMSTSKGVMTDKEARKENVGGEVFATYHKER